MALQVDALPRKPDPGAHNGRRELTPEGCHLTSTVVQPSKSSMPCAYTRAQTTAPSTHNNKYVLKTSNRNLPCLHGEVQLKITSLLGL